jgi:hypothetical protein
MMRTLLALTIFAAGTLTLNSAADADTARKSKRAAKQEYSKQYSKRQSSDQAACEERAQNEDRTGAYAGLPCWAREAMARGHNHSSN